MARKKRFVKLSKQERIWLEKGRKSGGTAGFRQRCHYILLSDQDQTIDEIANIYQVTRQSVTQCPSFLLSKFSKKALFL